MLNLLLFAGTRRLYLLPLHPSIILTLLTMENFPSTASGVALTARLEMALSHLDHLGGAIAAVPLNFDRNM